MQDEASEHVRVLPAECSVIIIKHSSGRICGHSLTVSHKGLRSALIGRRRVISRAQRYRVLLGTTAGGISHRCGATAWAVAPQFTQVHKLWPCAQNGMSGS